MLNPVASTIRANQADRAQPTHFFFALLATLLFASSAGFATAQESAGVVRGGEVLYSCENNDSCMRDEICFPPSRTCQPECTINCLVADPVCGTDGNTYVCGQEDAFCHGAEVAYEGECRERGCWVTEHCPADKICNVMTHTCQAPCDIKCRWKTPYCGHDGVTYECGPLEAVCNGTHTKHIGPCKDPCVCPDVYAPVCGRDGVTYGNRCEARCAGTRIAHEGECRDECRDNTDCRDGEVCFPPTDMCQPRCAINCLVPDPVCGTDGNTYVCGEMDAHCNGVEVEHPGECRDDCVCPDVWQPVCGVDGTTYGNPCEARCAGVEVAGPGPCICKPADCRCPEIYAPVCGVDGVTYSSPCEAGCKGVKIRHRGPCGEPPMCRTNEECLDNEVCGCAPLPGCPFCELQEQSLAPEICILGCVIDNPCNCLDIYKPVCGGDYRTYPNKCTAECAGVPIRSEGECQGPLPL